MFAMESRASPVAVGMPNVALRAVAASDGAAQLKRRASVGRSAMLQRSKSTNQAAIKKKKEAKKGNYVQIGLLALLLAVFLAGIAVIIGVLAVRNRKKSENKPSNFGEHYTAWRAYVPLAGLCYAIAIIFVSFWPFFVVVQDSKKQRAKQVSLEERLAPLRTPVAAAGLLCLGAIIICAQFSYTWDRDEVATEVVFAPFSGDLINCTVGMEVGLRGVNITMRGIPLHNERGNVLFNEHYGWAGGVRDPWAQGRNGYGKYSGNFNHAYRHNIEVGVPIAMQELSEYLTLDGERIRFGRDYRVAGYYTWIIMWLAFGEWALGSTFLMLSVLHNDGESTSDPAERATSEKRRGLLIKTGLDFSFLSGLCMIWACINWAVLKPRDFAVPFPGIGGGTAILKPAYGATFWVVLAGGLAATILSILRNVYTARTSTPVGLEDRGWFERLAASLQLTPRWLVVNMWMVISIVSMWIVLLRGQRKLQFNRSYFQQGNTVWERLHGKSVLEYSTALPPEAL